MTRRLDGISEPARVTESSGRDRRRTLPRCATFGIAPLGWSDLTSMFTFHISNVVRAALVAAVVCPLASTTFQERDLVYECGETATIIEDGRWVQNVTLAQALEHETNVNELALHLHFARERLLEDVECVYDCPSGALPGSCQPYASFDFGIAIGIPEPFSGGFSYSFGEVNALRGCHGCY